MANNGVSSSLIFQHKNPQDDSIFFYLMVNNGGMAKGSQGIDGLQLQLLSLIIIIIILIIILTIISLFINNQLKHSIPFLTTITLSVEHLPSPYIVYQFSEEIHFQN